MFSEEAKMALEHAMDLRHAAEALRHAFEEINAMVEAFGTAIEELAGEAQEEIDARKEERERWGHPPKRLLATYNQPMKKIRPCARSFGRR